MQAVWGVRECALLNPETGPFHLCMQHYLFTRDYCSVDGAFSHIRGALRGTKPAKCDKVSFPAGNWERVHFERSFPL